MLLASQGLLAVGYVGIVFGLKPASWRTLDAMFEWTSALTTTGFSVQSEPARLAPGGLPMLLVIAMTVGGLQHSTAGGIKVDRIVRFARDRFVRRFVVRWTAAAAAGAALVFALGGGSSWHALFEAASALGTVGLTSGVTHHDAGSGVLLVLIALMFIGRLELLRLLRAPPRRDRSNGRSGRARPSGSGPARPGP